MYFQIVTYFMTLFVRWRRSIVTRERHGRSASVACGAILLFKMFVKREGEIEMLFFNLQLGMPSGIVILFWHRLEF